MSRRRRRMRILIVDDEPDITFALKTMLQDYDGFAEAIVIIVDTFNNPVEALSNFKACKYDLLILDIVMPKMNGFELCQQLQNIDGKVKVCFITDYEICYLALREMFPTMEVDCFIAKPIGKNELVSRIKEELKIDEMDN